MPASRFLLLSSLPFLVLLSACQTGNLATVATSVCASGQQWQGGTDGSDVMQPGTSCINCHGQGEGPQFLVAGTVYAGQHESDLCGGVSGVKVDILDKDGNIALSATSNSAGNFFISQGHTLPKPYTARITYKGATRDMKTPQYSGDCANCHTKVGASDAPGRIAVP